MTSQRNLKSTLDSHRVKSVIPSDHLPIQAKFLLAKHIPRKQPNHNNTTTSRTPKMINYTPKKVKNPVHIDHNLLKNPKIRFKFKQDVINSINENDDLETFTSKIKSIELEHLNPEKKPDKQWFTHSIDCLNPILHNRNRASETTLKHLHTIRGIFKKAIYKAKNKWI